MERVPQESVETLRTWSTQDWSPSATSLHTEGPRLAHSPNFGPRFVTPALPAGALAFFAVASTLVVSVGGHTTITEYGERDERIRRKRRWEVRGKAESRRIEGAEYRARTTISITRRVEQWRQSSNGRPRLTGSAHQLLCPCSCAW